MYQKGDEDEDVPSNDNNKGVFYTKHKLEEFVLHNE